MRTIIAFAAACLVALSVLAAPAEAASASASHILVKDLTKCQELKKQIVEEGKDFAAVAKEHSTCPSGKRGGDLGTFAPGQMVKPFNDVVFNEEVGKVHGCVKTQFGHHLIYIRDRKD